MGTQSGRVIAIFRFFYDAWFAELYRLKELPFKLCKRVLLLETDNRFVNAKVVQLVGSKYITNPTTTAQDARANFQDTRWKAAARILGELFGRVEIFE